MYAFEESLLSSNNPFPADVFIVDDSKDDIVAHPHYHEYVELLYYLDGSARQQSNDCFYTAQVNDLFVLTRGDVHSTFSKRGNGCRILVIQFLPQIIHSGYSSLLEYKYIMPFLNLSGERKKHLSKQLENHSSIVDTILDIYREFSAKEEGYELIVKGGIVTLIGKLIRSKLIDMTKYNIFQKDIMEILPVLKHIESNLSEDINLQAAADMVNMSYFYFSRRFKTIIGKSFTEYMNYIRVSEAEKLILMTDYSIAKIAELVGYKTTNALDKVYQRIKRYKPSDLKRAKKGNF